MRKNIVEIEDRLGQTVTFCHQEAGKLTTGILVHGPEFNTIGLKNFPDSEWFIAIMHLNDLQRIRIPDKFDGYGPTIYGPYMC